MTRTELEHAIRAACDVSGDDELYVFGSQAILGQYPDAPEALRQSAEADVAPVHVIDMADVIDAQLGKLSQFHDAFGSAARSVEALLGPSKVSQATFAGESVRAARASAASEPRERPAFARSASARSRRSVSGGGSERLSARE